MADILTVKLLANYRQTATSIPEWSTQYWDDFVKSVNDGEINRFSVTAPTHFFYDISSYGSNLVMMIKNTSPVSGFGSFDAKWSDGLHTQVQACPAGSIMVIPLVSSATQLEFISAGGTQTFILALAAQ